MLGDKALELIKHMKRCDYLSPLQVYFSLFMNYSYFTVKTGIF